VATNFVDEYLVKLGATVDQSGMQRFYQALKEASVVTEASAAGIASAMGKASLEVVAGFTAMGIAAVGLIDKVGMADQSYRLFAMHMYMAKDAGRALKVTMDALGASMEDITWDPELRGRAHQLIADQRAMAPNGDFDAQMRKVRDIRFEFTRMEVEGEYLAMHVVQDFMKALGMGPDDLLKKLQEFNNWVTHNMPAISTKIVGFVKEMKPLWDDAVIVFHSFEDILKSVAVTFVTLMGVLTGDDSLSGSEFDMQKLGKAMHYVGEGALIAANAIGVLARELAATIALAADFVGVIANMQVYNWHPGVAWDFAKKGILADAPALGKAQDDMGKVTIDAAVGIYARNKMGLSGSASLSGNDPSSGSAHDLVSSYADKFGVPQALAHALAKIESGEDQSAVSPTGPRGVMQLARKTAEAMGVDRNDADGNVRGGMELFARLIKRYHGAPNAIAAYNMGEPDFDKVLAGKMALSGEARAEVAKVLRTAGQHGDVTVGSIVIHLDKPGHTNEQVASVVANKLQNMRGKATQRNLAEFQDQSYSY
jgi:soluble lytic murein transglycosylase-like protein